MMWRASQGEESFSSQTVMGAIHRRLAPAFGPDLSARDLSLPFANFVMLEQRVSGCEWQFSEADEQTRAEAIDYPLNARRVAGSRNGALPAVLPALCRGIERSPELYLRELTPPFSLIWSDIANRKISVQIDGLGQAPLYEFDDGRIWAISNRLMLLKELGVRLIPIPSEWAAWAAVAGWFPSERTGFRGITRVPPGTQFRIDRDGVSRSVTDVLSNWVHPPRRPATEWLEIARQSISDSLGEMTRFATNFDVGLSGGWDTRAIVSALWALDVDFRARVKGTQNSPDVIRATELAQRAGINLTVVSNTEIPSGSVEDSVRSIGLALRWQSGEMDIDKHKTLFAAGRRFDQAHINVMGQHGEIVRGRFYDKLVRENRISDDVPDEHIEEASVREYMKRLPPFVRPGIVSDVRDILIASIREADRFGLHGLERLDFHYVYEYTRRRNSGSLASQNHLVVAPFLSADMIRCCFGLPLRDKAFRAVHRHIIETNAPGWLEVPIAQFTPPFEIETPAETDPAGADEAFFLRSGRFSRYYDAIAWWKSAGWQLLENAARSNGLVSEVFEPSNMRARALAAPDEIVILDILAGITEGEPASAAASAIV
jgi:hypothetical protein